MARINETGDTPEIETGNDSPSFNEPSDEAKELDGQELEAPSEGNSGNQELEEKEEEKEEEKDENKTDAESLDEKPLDVPAENSADVQQEQMQTADQQLQQEQQPLSEENATMEPVAEEKEQLQEDPNSLNEEPLSEDPKPETAENIEEPVAEEKPVEPEKQADPETQESQPLPEENPEDSEKQPDANGQPEEDNEAKQLEEQPLSEQQPDATAEGTEQSKPAEGTEQPRQDQLDEEPLAQPPREELDRNQLTEAPTADSVENGGNDLSKLEDYSQRLDGVRDMTRPYYEEARTVAQASPENGRYYTDHGEDHVEMTATKAVEAGDAICEAVNSGNFGGETTATRIAFSPDIDRSTLEGAALSHDTGMRGSGYALGEKQPDGTYAVRPEDNSNFNEVRSNHSLNSAINILENREAYRELGYNDAQIDKMAAECMAHSKSSSGVRDLNSREQWSDCFDRIDSTVAAYNKDHPDSPITFNRETFEKDDAQLGSLASETFALRVGDVSRDSQADAITQTGEQVHIDRSSVKNDAGSVAGEIGDAHITVGDMGEEISPDNIKSRQVHTGEQNITENRSFADENGNFVHEVTVLDGSSAPACTQEALSDHVGELATAKNGNCVLNVKFDKPCDEFAIESYNDFRREIAADPKYSNVEITYPWDRR